MSVQDFEADREAERLLMERVINVADIEAIAIEKAHQRVEEDLQIYAEQIDSLSGQFSNLDYLSSDVVKTLYGLLPQIRRQVLQREKGVSSPLAVIARAEDGPKEFTDALTVAAHTYDTEITGFHDIPVTATPELSAPELAEQYENDWKAIS